MPAGDNREACGEVSAPADAEESAKSPGERLRGLSLRANFSWTLVGYFIYAGCQWGVLVVLAKLTTSEEVGIFALGLAVSTPILAFANLQLRQVQATDACQLYVFGDYMALRLSTTVLALFVISGVALIGYPGLQALVIIMVGLDGAFETMSDVCYGRLQQSERMDIISFAMIVKGPLSLIGLLIAVVLTNSLIWAVIGHAVGKLLVLVFYELPTVARLLHNQNGESSREVAAPHQSESLQPRWDLPTMRKLSWLSLPLGAATMLESLREQLPRYFIQFYLGPSALGIYAALSAVVRAAGLIVNSLGQSATPCLAKLYAVPAKRAFIRLLLKLVGVGLVMGVVGIVASLLLGRPVLMLLYTPEYAEQVGVFVVIAYAAAVSSLVGTLGYGIRAMRLFRPTLVLMIISTLTTAIAAYLLVPPYGLSGAAVSLLVGNAISGLIGCGIVVRNLRLLPDTPSAQTVS
jgi:O-antigen/teichoic acid export membrane protein